MSRTVRNAKLDSRSARVKLARKPEPYWTVISKGCALGYRKGAKGGAWIGRFRDEAGKQHYQSLGGADDALDSDGVVCLSYVEAQREAEKWFKVAANGFQDGEVRSGPYTVKNAIDDYMKAYKRKGGKSVDKTLSVIGAHILPELGKIKVSKLNKRRIEQWLDKLAGSAPMMRTAPGKPQNFRELDTSEEGLRSRKSTANRVLTTLKAALNHSYAEGNVSSDEGWRKVKPFREVDSSRVRYLSDDESRRLVNACPDDLRSLVQAALLTGGRYGELTAFVVADYNPDTGTVHIRKSKSGKSRHVVLTDEGQNFFDAAIAGKTGNEYVVTRLDGSGWRRSQQQRPFKAACKVAKIEALTFHELRHTYASRLVMSGAPLAVVAAQIGHSDTRMVEKYYGHMSPNYIADTVRQTFGDLGIMEKTNLVPFSTAASS